MERTRNIKKYSIIALIVSIIGLTIAYAAVSVSLKINATVDINKSGINVVFEKISGTQPSKSDGVLLTIDDPEVKQSGRTLDLGDITFNNSGDYYQYSINVVNKGKKTAKITGMQAPNLTELALTYFSVSYKYENGIDVGVNDSIASGQSKKVIIKVALKELTDEQYEAMPDDVVLNLNGLTITFEKDDGSGGVPVITSYTMAPTQITFSNPSKPSIETIQNIKHFSSNAPSEVNPNTIEKITFLNSKQAVEALGTTWDASEAGDGGVLATYTDSDSNGKYEVYIGADGKVAAPSNSFGLFVSLSELTQIDGLTYFDTSNATDMTGMFANDSKLASLDLSGFNTANVTSMKGMFISCTNLSNLILNNFNTSNVTDMESMFHTCSSLVNLNLGSFNTSNVTIFDNMFNGCSSLESLDIRNATFDSVDFTDTTKYSDAYGNHNANLEVIVKDNNTKTFLETTYGLEHVTVASS